MIKSLKSSTWNVETMASNPESKIVKTEFAQTSARLMVTWPLTLVTWYRIASLESKKQNVANSTELVFLCK